MVETGLFGFSELQNKLYWALAILNLGLDKKLLDLYQQLTHSIKRLKLCVFGSPFWYLFDQFSKIWFVPLY